jgi:hypothetical protein
MVAEKMEMARRTACNFWAAGKYPIELEELEAEAYAILVEASREYDPSTTILPWGPWVSQRILWRLEDFIQSWYRLSRVDYTQGQPGRRRHVPLTEGVDAVPGEDLATRLYSEDAERLIREVLTPREQWLVGLRYREGKNLKQIGRIMGLTHLRARQIHSDVMARLRSLMAGDARVADMAHRSRPEDPVPAILEGE